MNDSDIGPLAAKAALDAAVERLAEAEAERDRAREVLDAALALAGWRRLTGGFHSGETALYVSEESGDAFPLGRVLHTFEQTETA